MGSILALLSAALFAVAAVLVRRGMQGSTAITATLISVLTNLVALWALAAGTGGIGLITQPAAITLLAAGLFAPALARFTYYEAMNLIGVARASTISNTTPIFTAMLAVPVLGEHVTWGLAAGTVLVVLGLALTIRPDVAPALLRGRRNARVGARADAQIAAGTEAMLGTSVETAPAPHAGRPWAGALLALNTAVMASISFMLRKLGLRLLPDAAVASALTVTGSLLVLLPYALLRSGGQPFRAGRGAMLLLIISAVFTTGGFLSYFYALSLSEVVRVTPLSNTTPLFAMLLLAVFRQEAIRPATVVGALLTVAGVLFVVIG
jgi:drug/metabolite transporter (DMT)-like permease